MAPSSSIELCASDRGPLLDIARGSINSGLEFRDPPELMLAELPLVLRDKRGVFVTLLQRGKLRGCIGTLEAEEPLALAVADSAYGAAFRDTRFAPLQVDEADDISIEISVLTPMEPVAARSRTDLLAALRPECDGLLIQERQFRATFLPKVWRQLPDPDEFLNHLLAKAGLHQAYWSANLQCFRYQTLCFSGALSLQL